MKAEHQVEGVTSKLCPREECPIGQPCLVAAKYRVLLESRLALRGQLRAAGHSPGEGASPKGCTGLQTALWTCRETREQCFSHLPITLAVAVLQ